MAQLLPRMIAAAALVTAVTAMPATASACGTVEHGVKRYNHPDATDRSRTGALKILGLTCSGYVAVKSDREILPILSDAMRRGLPLEMIEKAFVRQRCLQGLRKTDDHAALSQKLDVSKCPTPADLKTWSVVTVGSAHLRRKPSTSSARVGAVLGGTIVETGRKSGDWFHIKTWEGAKGYIHARLVTPFLIYERGL
ncbi:MAG: SH3 domain-containing protein [Rhizobiales bacterium]|nr:SH3 domain-containing protein [Hyphomicrobiales bacterium]